MLFDDLPSHGVVIKIDVPDVQVSANWYCNNLDMVIDTKFQVLPYWIQLRIPTLPLVVFGLNLISSQSTAGSGSEVITFLVPDIGKARDELIKKGIEVSAISEPGDGIQLATFQDPYGNGLGIRQNPTLPKPA